VSGKHTSTEFETAPQGTGQTRFAEQPVPAPAHRPRSNVLLSHPTGNQNVRNALLSLVEHDMLAEFWTTIAWNEQSRWNPLLPGGLRAQLIRRSYPFAPKHRVNSLPWREAVRVGLRGTPFARSLSTGERPFSIITVYRHLDRRVARRVAQLQPGIVYAYEGGALQTFREAKKRGAVSIYEYPSAYWQWLHVLFREEAERNPQFAGLLSSLAVPLAHLEWKEEELRRADYVVVPSAFVKRTLAGVVPETRMLVIPYGAPEVKQRKRIHPDPGQPLKVLFAGALSQRKGIAYVLQAIRMLGTQVDFTMVGSRLGANPVVDQACREHRWFETLPHQQVLNEMLNADVLVLPSLSDAFGLVVTEALACGLPVIVTPNTGASEIVQDGRDGFLVPIGDAEAIADRLQALHRDRELLAEMSMQAQATAKENSWENYRATWARAVESVAWQ
jgi:starch synthase